MYRLFMLKIIQILILTTKKTIWCIPELVFDTGSKTLCTPPTQLPWTCILCPVTNSIFEKETSVIDYLKKKYKCFVNVLFVFYLVIREVGEHVGVHIRLVYHYGGPRPWGALLFTSSFSHLKRIFNAMFHKYYLLPCTNNSCIIKKTAKE